LYDVTGDKVVAECLVRDSRTLQAIHDYLTPCERSEGAAGAMRSGPVIGRLDFYFRSPRRTMSVEFVDAGKNPLCFRVGDRAYLRGGANYQDYQPDHKRLYGIDASAIDEGLASYRELKKICM
jgi:hypothetical protein